MPVLMLAMTRSCSQNLIQVDHVKVHCFNKSKLVTTNKYVKHLHLHEQECPITKLHKDM